MDESTAARLRAIGDRPGMQVTPPVRSFDRDELPEAGAPARPVAGSGHFVDHSGGHDVAQHPRLVLVWFGDDPDRPDMEQFGRDLFDRGIISCLSVYGVGR